MVTQTVMVGDHTELESDLVLPCVGLPPNKRSINKLVNHEYVDENNRIKVGIISAVGGPIGTDKNNYVWSV